MKMKEDIDKPLPTTIYPPPELREFIDAMRSRHRKPVSLSTEIVLMLIDWQEKWFNEHSMDEYKEILEDKETDEIELEIMREKIEKAKERRSL